MVISNAPSRLSPNARNSAAMNPLTHGLEPSCTTPNGPSMAVVSRPSPENSTTIPRQKTAACATLSRRPPDWPVEEVRHGDGNHREHAGREDGGQPEPERDQQKRVPSPARPCRACRLSRLRPPRIPPESRLPRRRAPRGPRSSSRYARPAPPARTVCRCRSGSAHSTVSCAGPARGVLLDLQLQQETRPGLRKFRYRS